MKMESMIADSPSYSAIFIAGLIGLTFNARIHYVVSAYSTIVYVDIPSPKSYSIPFFNFEDLFLIYIA